MASGFKLRIGLIMAGLLDFFGSGWEDPKSNAVMALAGGLLDGDFASGVKGYSQVMAGAKDAQLKRAMQQAQMDNLASEIESRKLAGVKYADQQKMIESVFGGRGVQNNSTGVGESPFPMGGMSTQNGAVGAPLQMPEGMMPTSRGSSVLGNLRPDDIARLKLGGLDLTDIYKYANDPQKLEQGSVYKDRNTGQERYMPKVGEGMMPNQQGVYGFAPGYAEAQARFEGDKTAAIEAAKSRFGTTDYTPPSGLPVRMTKAQELALLNGVQPAPMQGGQRPPVQNNSSWISPDAKQGQVDIYESEIRKWTEALKNPNLPQQEREMITKNLAGVNRELVRAGGGQSQSLAPNTAPQSAPSFGLPLQSQAGKDAQKLTAENAGKVNDVWLKSSYTPIVESKGATAATIDSINQSRASMNAMGGTGWGTETKATAANVLTGLGIGGKNAEMYATNAQTFQQAAMTRLQAELALQKGVQTKEDAERQSATYAQLKNTPQANSYILDSAQAKAERDLMKAKFYELALPIASKKGDLQEIDREWNKKMPSLFSMPSMQKWAKK